MLFVCLWRLLSLKCLLFSMPFVRNLSWLIDMFFIIIIWNEINAFWDSSASLSLCESIGRFLHPCWRFLCFIDSWPLIVICHWVLPIFWEILCIPSLLRSLALLFFWLLLLHLFQVLQQLSISWHQKAFSLPLHSSLQAHHFNSSSKGHFSSQQHFFQSQTIFHSWSNPPPD